MIKVFYKNFKMLRYIFKYCPSHIIVRFFQAISTNILSILNILFLKFVIDTIIEKSNFRYILAYALIFLCINIVVSFISTWLNQYISEKNSVLLDKGMSEEIFSKVSNLDYECYENTDFYTKYTIAIQQSNTRVMQILDIFSSLISSLIGITGYSILVTIFDPFLFIIVFINVFINLLFSFKLSNLKYKSYIERVVPDRLQGYARRVFYLNIYAKEMKLYTQLNKIIKNMFETASNKLVYIIKKYAKKIALITLVQSTLNNIISFSTMLYLAYKIFNNILKVSDYFTLSSSINQLTSQITTLFNIFPQLYENSLYIDDFFYFMNYPSKIENRKNNNVDTVNGDIKFENVYFSYPSNNIEKLKNINLFIAKNEKVAIVGENGSGKTTLIKLLTRLYNPDKGNIYMNSKNIKDYDITNYRENIGTVFQDFQIYSFSIIENVLMRPILNKEKDEKIVKEALEKVGLYDKIISFPNGLYTNVTNEFDDTGIFLSGGEAQLLVIARIYAKNCGLVILDEASSALDSFSEDKFINSILEIVNNKTVIFISHRLTHIKNVDKIFYMGNGKIKEQGTHDQLIKLKGDYFNLYSVQAKNFM